MRNACSPFGSDTMLVDKLIGTAYDIVKLVAANLPMLKSIGDRIDDFDLVAANIHNTTTVLGNVTGLGQTSNHSLGDVVQDDIISANVVIKGTDGKLYFPSATTFSFAIDLGFLRVTLAAGGPAGLINAAMKATIVTAESD